MSDARETSLKVYRQIQAEGLLNRRRWQVYSLLFERGPMTQMEAAAELGELDHSITPRFSELKRMNAIIETGEGKCKRTGRMAYLWGLTGKLPTALPKRVSSKKRIKDLEDRLKLCRCGI